LSAKPSNKKTGHPEKMARCALVGRRHSHCTRRRARIGVWWVVAGIICPQICPLCVFADAVIEKLAVVTMLYIAARRLFAAPDNVSVTHRRYCESGEPLRRN
jgi:hypothetical protein